MKKAKTGRKRLPRAEKTVLVGFYTKQKNVDLAGGMQAARERAKTLLEGSLQYAMAV